MSGSASRPAPKGWCPSAYRPMMSGDGLIVRIKPKFGRLTAAQATGVCNLANEFGSGLLDLTSRANLQIRGVGEEDHDALLSQLAALDLLPKSADLDDRSNVLITPFWTAGDLTHRLATALYDRLADLPDLPAKFGFAVDTGPAPILRGQSADIRLEQADTGILVLADGVSQGQVVPEKDAIAAAITLADWFAKTVAPENRRMAAHLKQTPLPQAWATTPCTPARSAPQTGASPAGTFYGAPFGQISAKSLSDLITDSGCEALRITPWRLVLTEDAAPVDAADFVAKPDDPLLQASACPGAPFCSSSSVKTRDLARRLAPLTDKNLHISGCSKGCARPRPTALTLVGNDGAFDLVKDGSPWDEPLLAGLSERDLIQRLGETNAL